MEAGTFLVALLFFLFSVPDADAAALSQDKAAGKVLTIEWRTLFHVFLAGCAVLTSVVFVALCTQCKTGHRTYGHRSRPRGSAAESSVAPGKSGSSVEATDGDPKAQQHSVDGNGRQPKSEPLLAPVAPNAYETPVPSPTYDNVGLVQSAKMVDDFAEDLGIYDIPRPLTNKAKDNTYDVPRGSQENLTEDESTYDVPRPYAENRRETNKKPEEDSCPVSLPSLSPVKQAGPSIVLKKEKYNNPPDSIEMIMEAFNEVTSPNVPTKDLEIVKKLGAGHFATVYEAAWSSPEGNIHVALKKIKQHLTKEDRVKFFQEAHIMAQFDHPNIVNLLGVTGVDTGFKECGILIELLPNGDLLSYLRVMKKYVSEYTQEDLCTALMLCASQVASGMEYLSGKSFVHRDLAARNILLDHNYHCKICDFGLARDLGDIEYYKARNGEIPVKWTAPEALGFRRYTTWSDVWSFGVVLFELWSLGARPMQGIPNGEVVQRLHAGYRMAPPPGCPRGIYKLMIKCWHKESEKRPSFPLIHGVLKEHGATIVRSNSADPGASQEAFVIGAELFASDNLYRDLQCMYK